MAPITAEKNIHNRWCSNENTAIDVYKRQRLDKATAIGMTPTEVCTLASIVEEETNNTPEKPMVARCV